VFFLPNASVIRYVIMFSAMMMATSLAMAEQAWTLSQSIQFALQHNRMLGVSALNVQQSEAEVERATGQLLPRLDFSSGVSRTDSPLQAFGAKLQQQRVTAADFVPGSLNHPGYVNNYQTRLGLSMPIFSGGELWAARQQASYQAQSSSLEYSFARQRLVFQTITAFVQARQAHAQLIVREKAVEAAEKRWNDVQQLKQRGMAINSDVMDANVQLLKNRVALDAARNAWEDSLDSLNQVLGREEDHRLLLAEPVLNFQNDELAGLLQEAESKRADLQSLIEQSYAADAARKASRSGYLPSVNLVAAQEWNSDTVGIKNRNTMMGLMVDMNLFAGGSDRARIRVAEAQAASIDMMIHDKRQQIGNEVRQAWRAVQTAEMRAHSEAEALSQSEESVRIKTLRYQQGLEKTSDLLASGVALDAARESEIRARHDLILARAALMLAAGQLHEGAVQ